MPSDAKILREQGREALREHWRQKERRKWERLPIEERHAIWRVKRERYLEAHPELRRYRAGPAPHYCARCSTQLQRWMDRKYPKYCSPACHRAAIHERSLERRLIGKSCAIRIQPCGECGELFTQHGSPVAKYCSLECRTEHWRTYSRNYQRRTRKTAIRYWRIANTPEAQKLAETYFELRLLVRGKNDYRRQA